MSEIDKIVAEYFEVVDGRICPDWRSITEQELRSALIRAAEGRWVKVEDALPEGNVDCLVWNGYARRRGFYAEVDNPFGDIDAGNWYTLQDNNCYYKVSDITHWRLLPTPPTD